MPSPDLAIVTEPRVVCSVAAAASYGTPAELLLAVAEKEGGQPGQAVLNGNGTRDYGPLQFNSTYIASLAHLGIMPSHVLAGGCFPYQLAAWRLQGHITRDAGDLWTRAANYHSRTPNLNATYREDLIKRADKWREWLIANLLLIPNPPATPMAANRPYQPRSITMATSR